MHCNIEGWLLMSSVQLHLVFINLKHSAGGSNMHAVPMNFLKRMEIGP